jgi:hypothetical protein
MRTLLSPSPKEPNNGWLVVPTSGSLQQNALEAFESDYPVDIRDTLPPEVRMQSFWKTNLLAGLFLQTIVESVNDLPVSENMVLTEYLDIGETLRTRLGFWCNSEDWDIVYDDYIIFCTDMIQQSVSLEQLLEALLRKYSTPEHKDFWQEDALGKVVYQLAIFHICTHSMRVDEDGHETPGADSCFESVLTDDISLPCLLQTASA